jgi:hypothetical protein
MRLKPGPLVAVAALTPVRAAPIAEFTAAISSSVWKTTMEPTGLPSTLMDWWASMKTDSSEAGVIG